METELNNYKEAVQASLEAINNEFTAKAMRRKAHYALVKAREELRAVEQELLIDKERELI